MRTFIWLMALVLLVALVGLTLVWNGSYDVGADSPHRGYTRALLEYARERSIDRRSRGIDVPQLDDPALIAAGAEHYAAMCTGCHLAPGVTGSELREGLNPMPPDLTQQRAARDPGRTFWIVKHGVKMTGMPAWGVTHDDASLWGIVAFVEQLPQMTPDRYAQLTAPPAGEPAAGGAERPPAHDHSTHKH
jgi:mono/diheme cytochrome c family protein